MLACSEVGRPPGIRLHARRRTNSSYCGWVPPAAPSALLARCRTPRSIGVALQRRQNEAIAFMRRLPSVVT